MTKASKDQDATWEFIRWWNTPENQIAWYLNAGGNAPSRKSLYGKPPASDNPIWKPLLPYITESAGNSRPMSDRYTAFVESMTPVMLKGLSGGVTPKDAVDEAPRIGNTFWQGIGGNPSKAL
jgi:ABC-type glycerol-3-phosphate transport system substrate-binding protein